MEVPRLGTKWELQLPVETTATKYRMQAVSATNTIAHKNAGYSRHRVRLGGGGRSSRQGSDEAVVRLGGLELLSVAGEGVKVGFQLRYIQPGPLGLTHQKFP